MPAPYSYDLRRKVIEAIDGGMGKTQASKIFKISRNTINLWLQKREKTGDYRASVGYQQGYDPKITDLEEFKEFARKHGSQTQKEMASSWQGEISDKYCVINNCGAYDAPPPVNVQSLTPTFGLRFCSGFTKQKASCGGKRDG